MGRTLGQTVVYPRDGRGRADGRDAASVDAGWLPRGPSAAASAFPSTSSSISCRLPLLPLLPENAIWTQSLDCTRRLLDVCGDDERRKVGFVEQKLPSLPYLLLLSRN